MAEFILHMQRPLMLAGEQVTLRLNVLYGQRRPSYVQFPTRTSVS